jgi:TonB family protein
MPAVPQKIRTGLVELRTKSGAVYVGPSFLERIYLLWTFRNFRSLPKQVLNRREQRLIDKLCRTATVSRRTLHTRDSIIGAVENVELMPESKTEAGLAPPKVVNVSVPSRVLHSAAISVPAKRTAQAADSRFREKRKVQPIAESQVHSAESGASKHGRGAHRSASEVGGWDRWAAVGLCGLAVVGIRLHFENSQPVAPVIAETAIGVYRADSASPVNSGTIPASAVTGQIQQTSDRKQLNQGTTSDANSPSSVKRTTNSSNLAITARALDKQISERPQLDRLEIAEAPENWSYPLAPDSALTGKVSLQAVVAKDGTVSEVDVLSGQRALAQAAVRAVKHWRYHAREINGNAVEAVTKIDIKFLGDDVVSISYPEQ